MIVPNPRRWTAIVLSVAFALVTLLLSTNASAIPAFARRYETSCQTCHLAFPRLTPFGEAFRRNAYRFPSGGDATIEKEEPVPLGADAQKDLWPRSVYPGQLARTLPVSVLLNIRMMMGSAFESGHAAEEAAAPEADGHGGHGAAAGDSHKITLNFRETHAALFAGGSLGSFGGYFAAITFGGHAPVELERAFVVATPIDQTALHLRVGAFEPSLHGVSIHRGMLGHQLRLTTTRVRLNSFTPEASLRGFETSGLVAGRLGWFAGVVENVAPASGLTADLYGRVETKFGGMRLDGVDSKAQSAAWRERSLTLGLSGYRGRSRISETLSLPPDVSTHTDTFVRGGADAHVIFDDLLVDFVIARQRHDGPELRSIQRTMDLVYGEVTYVILPWLFPTVRAEISRISGPGMSGERRFIAIAAVNAVLRPNVVLRGEAATGSEPGGHTEFRFAALNLAVGI